MKISKKEEKRIDALVEHYKAHLMPYTRLAMGLRDLFTQNDRLPSFIHSLKWRVKDPDHLRDKLRRRMERAKEVGKAFDFEAGNLFERVTDLAGVRILHLHTTQMEVIDKHIRALLDEEEYRIIEGPFARTWDDENRAFFRQLGIKTEESSELYTSVHYVVETGIKAKLTAEIQVRTLAEELWGEVTHTVNYPHPSDSLACREQIKVLARVTSSCTRLVDAIFKVQEEQKRVALPGKSAH